jgi:hypothetical protein
MPVTNNFDSWIVATTFAKDIANKLGMHLAAHQHKLLHNKVERQNGVM